jgi:hypothetical protein
MPAVQEQPIVETVSTVRRTVEPEYLDTVAAAAFLGISAITLEKWRTLRIGPPYTSLPRCTRYAVKDLREFMSKHRIEAEDKPFNPEERRGRPRKDGSRANAATGTARHAAEAKKRVEKI